MASLAKACVVTVGYREIFATRGDRYHLAMSRAPLARRREFSSLFLHCRPSTGQRILDYPAGGGYLSAFLPRGAELVSLELTDGFGGGVRSMRSGEEWVWGLFDHVVCLAALHHIEDRSNFVMTLMATLKPEGTLHLADVPAGSGISHFLDGFVGNYNVTGHTGHYLEPDAEEFTGHGKIERAEVLACPWEFDDEDQMLMFCTDLFGLVDCPRALLRDALTTHVGVRQVGERLFLDWKLCFVDIRNTTH